MLLLLRLGTTGTNPAGTGTPSRATANAATPRATAAARPPRVTASAPRPR